MCLFSLICSSFDRHTENHRYYKDEESMLTHQNSLWPCSLIEVYITDCILQRLFSTWLCLYSIEVGSCGSQRHITYLIPKTKKRPASRRPPLILSPPISSFPVHALNNSRTSSVKPGSTSPPSSVSSIPKVCISLPGAYTSILRDSGYISP